jgi:ATP-binding cassette subfamily C protein LapB
MSESILQSSSNPQIWSEEQRMQRIASVIGARRMKNSAIARSLPALLIALDWLGAPRTLLATLPGLNAAMQANDLQATLQDIGFFVHKSKMEDAQDLESLPVGALAIGPDSCRVFLGRQQDQYCWHDGETVSTAWQPASGQELWVVRKDFNYSPPSAPHAQWFASLLHRARGSLLRVGAVSLAINLLALITSLFTMTVYNQVIPSGAVSTLWSLGFAVAIAAVGSWFLREGRGKALAELGGWAGSEIGRAGFRKTLGLSLDQTARIGISNNLNRIRSLESSRQFLGGMAGVSLLDYPFVLIFLIVIALLGGWIVLVPVAGLGLFYLTSLLMQPYIQRASEQSGRASNRMQEEYAMALQHLRSLRGVGENQHLLRRMRDLVVQTAEANRQFALTNALVQSIGQALSSLTVLGTMGIGVLLVLQGSMSTGGLIAAMMLIWRITSPAQQLFSTSANFRQLRASVNQLNALMASAGELINPQMASAVESLKPRITADRLYYRYSADQEPALNGVSFELPEGSRLVVAGPNGAGKSTLLQCLAGLHQLQSGRMLVDGRDIRQFDPSDYRAWLSYMSQSPQMLPMTIPQLMQLSHPRVTGSEICQALARVAGAQWWLMLGSTSAANALTVQLELWRDDAASVRKRYIVAMAEVLLDNPKLIILDDPLRDYDPLLDSYLQQLLDALHGNTTVVIATHRADLIRNADLIAILDRGNLIHFGPVAAEQPAQPLNLPVLSQ